MISDYELVENPLSGVFVRSKEQISCPCCNGKLKCIGSRTRKFTDNIGDKKLRIRRLRCKTCNKIHHELPDFLIPYKRYGSKGIESVVMDDKNTPVPADESTLFRWRTWFKESVHHFIGCLTSIAIRLGRASVGDFYNTMSLLQRLWHYVGDAEGWLARVVRSVVNSNNWVHTRSAFLT